MKYLITSALPYVNGTKHLGNLVGSLLPSDVYARYLRLKGHEVLYICGTDEHGSPTEIAAKKENITPEELCLRQYKIQQEMNKFYNLSFDYFGRSSSLNNIKLTQYIAKKLEENGLIEEKTIKQFFSVDDNMFLADRFIIGTCPYCKYENARGDQCENCTRVLDPIELINPRYAISNSSKLEIRETKHLFLCQSKLKNKLKEWIKTKNKWSKLVKSIANKWLNDGLQDRCITRDLKWGVPVDKIGYENKVFYVWFDAPIAYIATTKDWAEQNNKNYMDWWSPNDDTCYIQFMGKDNVPFHSITFPATIMGSGSEFKQPDIIKGFSWLNYYGGKFSTSLHRGIFMNQAMELYPADYWRYYLMSIIPETDDSNFTWEGFANTINSNLADTLGNFVQRVFVLNEKYFNNIIPKGYEFGKIENDFKDKLKSLIKEYESYMENLEFRKAINTLYSILSLTNSYLVLKEPWKTGKEGNLEDTALTLRYCFNLQRICAILIYPFIPSSAEKILKSLSIDLNNVKYIDVENIDKELNFLTIGSTIKKTDILFKKISKEEVEKLKEQFGDDSNIIKQKGKEIL